MIKYFRSKIKILYLLALVRFYSLTPNKVNNFIRSLFVTFIIINISFCFLAYFFHYNPSIYIRTFINIFFLLPIVRSITNKSFLVNYCINNKKEKIFYAVIHFFKTCLYSYIFSILIITLGIFEIIYLPLLGFILLTLLTMDVQILGNPDYCMGPDEEQSLTVRNNTSSELSKRVVETGSSKSSSAIKRSHSQTFNLNPSQLEVSEVERARRTIRRGETVHYLPDGSLEYPNDQFKPRLDMPFNKIPAEIPPSVSKLASPNSVF